MIILHKNGHKHLHLYKNESLLITFEFGSTRGKLMPHLYTNFVIDNFKEYEFILLTKISVNNTVDESIPRNSLEYSVASINIGDQVIVDFSPDAKKELKYEGLLPEVTPGAITLIDKFGNQLSLEYSDRDFQFMIIVDNALIAPMSYIIWSERVDEPRIKNKTLFEKMIPLDDSDPYWFSLSFG
jgi:hypothetical protein